MNRYSFAPELKLLRRTVPARMQLSECGDYVRYEDALRELHASWKREHNQHPPMTCTTQVNLSGLALFVGALLGSGFTLAVLRLAQ